MSIRSTTRLLLTLVALTPLFAGDPPAPALKWRGSLWALGTLTDRPIGDGSAFLRFLETGDSQFSLDGIQLGLDYALSPEWSFKATLLAGREGKLLQDFSGENGSMGFPEAMLIWTRGADTVKIGRYEVATGAWTFVQYALDVMTLPNGAVIGLSEITPLPNGTFAIIERDGLAGTQAVQKKIYGVDLATADFQPFGSPLTTVSKTLLADVLDELQSNTIYTPDKLEGLAVAADGEVYMVTDNDGLDSALGQTLFIGLGRAAL